MRHFLAAFFEIISVFILCCAVLFGLINSTPGKDQLAEMINILSGNRVMITGLTGLLPTDFSIKNLTLTPQNGDKTVLSDVHIQFSPLHLWHSDLYFSHISVGSVKFIREPDQEPKAAQVSEATPFRLTLPGHLSLQIVDLRINRIFLPTFADNPAIQQENPLPASFGLQGHILLQKNRADIFLTSLPKDKALHLILSAEGPAEALSLALRTQTSEPGRPDLMLKAAGLLNLNTQEINLSSELNARHFLREENPQASLFWQNFTARALLTGTLQIPVFKIKATAERLSAAKFAFPYPLHLYLSGKTENKTLFLQTASLLTKEGGLTLKGRIRLNRNNLSASPTDLTATAALNNLQEIFPALSGYLKAKAVLQGAENNRYFSLQSSGVLLHSPLSVELTGHLLNRSKLILNVHQSHWKSARLTGNITLTPTLQAASGAKGQLLLKVGQLGDLTGGDLTGSLQARLIVAQQIHFSALLQNIRSLQGFALNSATLETEGLPRALHFSLAVTGKTALSAKALLNLPDREAEILTLNGQQGAEHLTLLHPFFIKTRPFLQSSPGLWQLSRQSGRNILPGGTASLGFSLPENQRFTLAAEFRQISLSQLTSLFPLPMWQGSLSGSLSLKGRLPFKLQLQRNNGETLPPEAFGSLSLTGKNILPAESADLLPPLTLKSQIRFEGTHALLSLLLKNQKEEASLSGEIPLFSRQDPINLTLRTHLNPALFNAVLAITGQQVQGSLNSLLHITGSLHHPLANGTLTLRNGSFTDFNSGFNLADINSDITVQRSVFTVNRLSVRAGPGKITAIGHFSPFEPGMPVLLTVKADRAEPLSTDLMSGNFSGALTLSGSLLKMLSLTGRLVINRAQFNIPASLPPDVASLEIKEPGQDIVPLSQPQPHLTFDLSVSAPNSVFVAGRGIFANFRGTVHVKGTNLTPRLTGSLTLNRGHLNLGSTTLTLSNGKIIFDGGPLANPAINLSASNTSFGPAGQVTATLTVAGTLQAPKFLLSSNPDMPTDQILSQLIFGAPRTDLGPFELTTLAEVMADLSGWNSAADFNPVGSVQKRLNLSQLTVTKDSQGSESLEVGKYVAHNLYIGASKSLTSSGAGGSASLNLGHGFTLNTTLSTAPGTGSSLGFSYTHQY